MQDSSDAGQSGLDELIRQVLDLQTRVRNLELNSGVAPIPMAPALADSSPGNVESAAAPALNQTAALIPIFGKALLAIAAAYL